MTGPPVTIIGIGNTLMGDDGVGVRVAEALSERGLPDGAEVVMGAVAGMGLVGHLLSSSSVVFVDAIDAGDTPGSIYRFRPEDAGITQLRSNTTHGISVGQLVATAHLAGARPDVLVYAVQVGDVTFSPDRLSPAVDDVVAHVADLVFEDVETMLARATSAPATIAD